MTITFPVVAPTGTGTTIAVELQLMGIPATPLNVTELVPCVEPKFVPIIVSVAPIVVDVVDRFVMLGI